MCTTPEEFNFWLARFFVEAQRKDGNHYPPRTLYQLACGILHKAREVGRYDLNFLDEKSAVFASCRNALDAQMKRLTAAGVGTTRKEAKPISEEDEQKLWENGIVNYTTAQGLSYGAFFYNCKAFGFRGFDEHHSLEVSQYTFGSDEVGKYVVFTGKACKNYQGGIHQRNVMPKSVKQYANKTSPDRCIVCLFRTYLDNLPQDDTLAFYRRPLPLKDGRI